MSDKPEIKLTPFSTPEMLLPGDLDALDALARQLQAFGGNAGESARRLRELDNPCLWTGKASEGFQEQMGKLPKKLDKGASAFSSASTALFACTASMRALRTRVKNEVIPAAIQASTATANWNADKAAYEAAKARGEDQTMSLMEPEKKDPGKKILDAAEDLLDDLRGDWRDAENACAKILKDKADDAPEGEGWLSNAVKDFVGGAWDATVDLASTAWQLSPIRAAIDPQGFYTDLAAMGQGLQYAVTNPVEFAKTAVNWEEWAKNPYRAAGMLVPDLVLTAATGGAGKVPSTITKLDQAVPGTGPDVPGAKPNGTPGPSEPKPDQPDPNACAADRAPDARLCQSDPVDVATGEMVLPQTDVALAGTLPLTLTREHRTHRTHGRWFGRRWASTLDQHLELGPDGVLFLGADGVELRYPVPEPDAPVYAAGGDRWPLRWDGHPGGAFTITDPRRGWTWTFAPLTGVRPSHGPFGPVLPLRSLADRNGNHIDYLYDADGRPYEITHSGGYRIAVDTSDDRITAFRLLGADPETHQPADDPSASIDFVRFIHDETGNLTEVVNSSGRPQVFTYDDEHRVTSWTDRIGSGYQYTYDDAGRCIHGAGTDGALDNTFTYDTDAQVTHMTDALGAVRTFAWDRWGRVVRETDALGNTTHTAWDAYNRRAHVTDPLGHRTHHTYDTEGNLTAALHPDGTYTLIDHDPLLCCPTRIINPDGTRRHHIWDERGNLLAVVDEAGARTEYGYNASGALTETTDALGGVTRHTVDASGLPVAITNPLGHTMRATRDAFGRLSTVTDALGHTTRLAHTVEGKPAWRELADGSRELWTWDAEGNLVHHLNAAGFTTRHESGTFDLPTARTDPDGNRYTFTYDAELRLTTVTNPQNLTWTYGYDAAGRLTSETDFNGRTLAYTHDAAGRLATRVNGAGEEVAYARDPFGNVTESVHTATGRTTTYAYDPAGRLVRATNPDVDLTFTRDACGRILTETSNGRTLATTYDLLGRRVRRETPSGQVSTWTYDAAGQPTRLETAGHTLDFAYDPAGRETTRHFGAQVTFTQEWDAADRLVAQALAVGERPDKITAALTPGLDPTETHRRTYSWRPDGYITAIHDTATGTKTYDLDTTGRVTTVTAKGWTERYAYDNLGNITNAEWPAAPGSSAEDAQGRRRFTGTLIRHAGRTTYEHDAQGRLIRKVRRSLSGKTFAWTFAWDADDRLTTAGTPQGEHWNYVYDALGRRTAKSCTANGQGDESLFQFSWDSFLLAEQTAATGDIATWDHAPDNSRPVKQTKTHVQQPDNPEVRAVITDAIGTPIELVAADGTTTWRNSKTLWGIGGHHHETESTPLCFPGQLSDPETGLNQNLFRSYEPESGSYVSPDPLGLEPAPNHHAYVPNPHTWADPLGLAACEVTSSISKDPMLVKAADAAGKDQRVQKELDDLVQQYINGNKNPGLGNKSLSGTGIMYMRGRNGARVFFRDTPNGIEIVAKASKGNEPQVIKRLNEIYGR